jgi:crotonobetainyl-CoA:carnitine CoA-transferase CaiB-like acyl-CoA transferase
VEVEQPLSGKVKLGGSVFKMSRTPGDRKQRIPLVGEYNEDIYSELLGYSEEDLEKLRAEGTI